MLIKEVNISIIVLQTPITVTSVLQSSALSVNNAASRLSLNSWAGKPSKFNQKYFHITIRATAHVQQKQGQAGWTCPSAESEHMSCNRSSTSVNRKGRVEIFLQLSFHWAQLLQHRVRKEGWISLSLLGWKQLLFWLCWKINFLLT